MPRRSTATPELPRPASSFAPGAREYVGLGTIRAIFPFWERSRSGGRPSYVVDTKKDFDPLTVPPGNNWLLKCSFSARIVAFRGNFRSSLTDWFSCSPEITTIPRSYKRSPKKRLHVPMDFESFLAPILL
jgi:hypothetical protein